MLVWRSPGHVFAVPIAAVSEVTRAVALTSRSQDPLPGRNPGVLGYLDLRGAAIPVFDLGSDRSTGSILSRSDRFVILRTSIGAVAVVASSVDGVAEVMVGDVGISSWAGDADGGEALPAGMGRITSGDRELVAVLDADRLVNGWSGRQSPARTGARARGDATRASAGEVG